MLALAQEAAMPEPTAWETIKVQGSQIVDELKKLLHEGNVRRVIVKQKGRSVAEFPVTAGVVGVLVAPVLAAIGALVAVLADCSIEVERVAPAQPPGQARQATGSRPAKASTAQGKSKSTRA
jgi:hypothetical protein